MVTMTGGDASKLLNVADTNIDLVKGIIGAVDGMGPRVRVWREKPHPHLLEYRARGDVFKVVFRSCGPIRIITSASVDIFTGIRRHDGKQKGIVGVALWGVSDVLQEYKKSSISLEHLIRRFERYHSSHGRVSVFGEYKEQILAIARKHQFVWWIPE